LKQLKAVHSAKLNLVVVSVLRVQRLVQLTVQIYKAAVGAKIIKQLNAAGSPKARLALAEPYRHQTELVENIDYTIEDSRYVFSEWYHLKRARCCGNGCRHCAYK